MIRDYQAPLSTVVHHLAAMGFTLEEDAEFWAIFKNEEGWKIVFEGERYVRPAFDITIEFVYEDKKRLKEMDRKSPIRYSIRILMKVFERIEHIECKVPSLENQLEFLRIYMDKIFIYPPTYTDDYNRENKWVP